MEAQPIALVVPCYNEAGRFAVEEVAGVLDAHPALLLVLVDDGSTDATADVLGLLADRFPGRVLVHRLAANAGKAGAVRAGMLLATATWPQARYIGYFDADLATPLQEALRLRQAVTPREPAIIMGSRVKLMGTTDIKRLEHRHYFGRFFATLVSMQLRLPVYDTQCGAKLVRRDMVGHLFDQPFLTRWLFDVEILWRCMVHVGHAAMWDEVAEVPVSRWHERPGSKVDWTDAVRVPMQLRRIARHYRGRVRW
jgi:dolichyl-phosphate beta-glucosyltransferase